MKHDYKLVRRNRDGALMFVRFLTKSKKITHTIHLHPEVRRRVYRQMALKQMLLRNPTVRKQAFRHFISN